MTVHGNGKRRNCLPAIIWKTLLRRQQDQGRQKEGKQENGSTRSTDQQPTVTTGPVEFSTKIAQAEEERQPTDSSGPARSSQLRDLTMTNPATTMNQTKDSDTDTGANLWTEVGKENHETVSKSAVIGRYGRQHQNTAHLGESIVRLLGRGENDASPWCHKREMSLRRQIKPIDEKEEKTFNMEAKGFLLEVKGQPKSVKTREKRVNAVSRKNTKMIKEVRKAHKRIRKRKESAGKLRKQKKNRKIKVRWTIEPYGKRRNRHKQLKELIKIQNLEGKNLRKWAMENMGSKVKIKLNNS